MRRAACALLLLLLTACGDTARQPAPTQVATPTAPATASETLTETTAAPSETLSSPPGDAAQTVEVFVVREPGDGGALWLEPVEVALDRPTDAVARAAMEALVTFAPDEPQLVNLTGDGATVLGVDLDGATLVVDLDFPNDDLGLGSGYEAMAFAQITHTGAQFATVERVQVLEEGRTPPSGHSDWSVPLEPDPFQIVPIDITQPEYSATVPPGDVTVSGTANTFEATVELQLVGPNGEVVDSTFTTATCGSGCRGTWEHTFSLDEPGTWTVVATEPDPSGGEGRPPFSVEHAIVVQ